MTHRSRPHRLETSESARVVGGTAIPKGQADGEQDPAAEPDEPERVKAWALVAGAVLMLALLLLSLAAAGTVALGVVWLAKLAERHLGLESLETTLAFVGVALLIGLLIGASRIAEAVRTAIREQTLLVHELEDTLESHVNQLRGLSEELDAAEISSELKRRRGARRGESARHKTR